MRNVTFVNVRSTQYWCSIPVSLSSYRRHYCRVCLNVSHWKVFLPNRRILSNSYTSF